DRRAPTPVIGLGDALELVAGSDHTCARLRDRSVVCWGSSASGQLGDGARSTASLRDDLLRRRRGEAGPARPEPAPVVGLGPADALVAARSYTCALVGGDPWCWGRRV